VDVYLNSAQALTPLLGHSQELSLAALELADYSPERALEHLRWAPAQPLDPRDFGMTCGRDGRVPSRPRAGFTLQGPVRAHISNLTLSTCGMMSETWTSVEILQFEKQLMVAKDFFQIAAKVGDMPLTLVSPFPISSVLSVPWLTVFRFG